MIEKSLQQMGFTESEAKVYVALLKIGPQAVSVIAKKAGFNRTTTYSILLSLEKKAIVSWFLNKNMRFFKASDPNSLVAYFDRQSKTFDYYRDELSILIPKLRQLTTIYDYRRPLISYFDGTEGIKHVMYDILSSKTSILSYAPVDKWLESDLEIFFSCYRNFMIDDEKISFKLITLDKGVIRDFFKDFDVLTKKRVKLLFVDKLFFEKMFRDGFNLYDDKISMIHLARGEEYGVIIESKEFSTVLRSIFEMNWENFSSGIFLNTKRD